MLRVFDRLRACFLEFGYCALARCVFISKTSPLPIKNRDHIFQLSITRENCAVLVAVNKFATDAQAELLFLLLLSTIAWKIWSGFFIVDGLVFEIKTHRVMQNILLPNEYGLDLI